MRNNIVFKKEKQRNKTRLKNRRPSNNSETASHIFRGDPSPKEESN